jgi:hypothetical protein
VGIGVLSIWRFIAMLSRDQVDAFTLAVGVLGTLVILVVILAIPAARSRNRIRFLRRTNPGSVVLTVTVYPEAADQLIAMSKASGGSTHHMWGNIWAELWCDGEELRVYGGTLFGFGARPTILASIPLPAEWTASVARAKQGTSTMNTLQIAADFGGQRAVVNHLPTWSAGVALLPYYRAHRIQAFADEIQGRLASRDPRR